jgi:hypothetical protein
MATAKKAAPKSAPEAATAAANYWVESSRDLMEPARELTEIAKRAFEKTSEQNQLVAQRYVDFALSGSKMWADVRDVNTLLEKQLDFMKTATEQFSADTEAYTKVVSDAQAEYTAWAQKSAKAATSKFEQAMSKVA